jgi:hypothetical protein
VVGADFGVDFYIWNTNRLNLDLPWAQSVRGIAVCQTFLWVFNDREIAYISHEDASRARGQGNWHIATMRSGENGVPPAQHESARDFIKWLCPCDDGELIAVFDATPYTTKWERNSDDFLVLGPWKSMENPLTPGQSRYIGSFSRRGRNTRRGRLLSSRSSTPRRSRRRAASHKTES